MIELTNDKLIKMKAFCIQIDEEGGTIEGVWPGWNHITVFDFAYEQVKVLFMVDIEKCDLGDCHNVSTVTGWRWRIDRLLEFVPNNKPINFWGWGVDTTGYIFPILGTNSDCERVEFVSPAPLDKG